MQITENCYEIYYPNNVLFCTGRYNDIY